MGNLLVILTAFVCLSDDEPAFEHYALQIEQNGKIVPIEKGTVHLRKAPFTLRFLVRKPGAVHLHVSRKPSTIEGLKSTDDLDEIPNLKDGMALAEHNGNPDRDLLVDIGGNHYLYFEDKKRNRFDSVRRVGDHWILTRTVEKLSFTGPDQDLMSVKVSDWVAGSLYLATAMPRRFRTRKGIRRMALAKQTLAIQWKK